MGNYSPLRYPGGKSALYPAISGIIKSNKMDHCIYVEPFAGGANIAWSLLIDGVVSISIELYRGAIGLRTENIGDFSRHGFLRALLLL